MLIFSSQVAALVPAGNFVPINVRGMVAVHGAKGLHARRRQMVSSRA
jgi:hypothetical protein